MKRFVVRRTLLILPVLFGVTLLVFLLVHFSPGDPVLLILGSQYSEAAAADIREQLGLDKPLWLQYTSWLNRVVHGRLGESLFSRQAVIDMIRSRVPTTAYLAAGATVFGVVFGVLAGTASAVGRRRWPDSVIRAVSTLGISVPSFWVGLLFIIYIALRFSWLPAGGSLQQYGLRALILPVISLGLYFGALVTRMVRSTMLEVLRTDFVRTARAKGLAEKVVLYRHALRNASIPVLTMVGLQFGYLLGGAVLTETVFALTGVGRLLIQAINHRDYPLIQGVVLVVAVAFVLVNLAVDLIYGYLDPRIRYE